MAASACCDFDLWIRKANQHILEPNYICDQNWVKFPQKTRVSGLSYGVVSVILALTIFVQLRLVTDGRMDGETDTR